MSIDLLLSGLQQGLILTLVAYGVMIPFRLLNFPDLTAEGAYTLGGTVCASLLISGINPIQAILISGFSAGMLGMCTGIVHFTLKINTLLAGIILSTMVYSINLRIMGKPNIPIFDIPMVLTSGTTVFNIILLLSIIFIVIMLLRIFLYTELGLCLRAVGLNIEFAKRQNISIAGYTLLGLFIANGLTGLAGALIVQSQHYMDVGMGVGIVIHALAALMIGESVLGNQTITKQIFAPFVGALIYQQIQGMALLLGLGPSDLKLLTGIIVLVIIGLKRRPYYA